MQPVGLRRALSVVFGKEVRDNFRDRRTLMSALLMGPLFGPILFAFVINLSLKQTLSDEAEALDLPVLGQQHAPNLVRYLESQNIDVIDAPASREAALEAVKQGRHDVVVVIPETFAEQFSAATPARIEIITDQANRTAEREARRARRALAAYNQELAGMRLLLRGINPVTLRP